MLLLLSLAAAALPIVVQSHAKATATVTILTPGRSSKVEWEETRPSQRKEIIVDEGNGRKIRVRLIEFE